MAIQLGSAYGKVEVDASGVVTGVKTATASLQDLSRVGDQVGSMMQSLGQKMTIGITLPVVAAGAASIKAASDLQESMSKVNVVFGDSADEIVDWSETAATSFGQSKQQALEAAGTFGNLFTTMGVTGDEASDMSMKLVELASDLASFNNISPEEALVKLRAGLVGETEPLRTLGINLTAASVKAKAMEMGLADANGELSQSALLQARYALMLEQSTNAQGDFARTADGMANQTRIVRAQMQDALAEFGENILPIALQVVQGLNQILQFFINLPEPVQNAIIIFAGFMAVLGPIIGFLGTLISFASGIVTLSTTLSGLGITFGGLTAALSGVGAAIGAALLPLLPILALIAASVLLVYLLWKNWGTLGTTLSQLGTILRVSFLTGLQLIGAAVKQAGASIKEAFSTAFESVKLKFSEIVTSLTQKINEFVTKAKTAWTNIQNAFTAIFGRIASFASGVFSRISGAISNLIGWVNNLKASLSSIQLPEALTPGSPTPFENGLVGIRKQMAALSKSALPSFGRAMADPSLVQNPMLARAGGGTSSQNIINMASGVTLRDVDALFSQRMNDWTRSVAGGI